MSTDKRRPALDELFILNENVWVPGGQWAIARGLDLAKCAAEVDKGVLTIRQEGNPHSYICGPDTWRQKK